MNKILKVDVGKKEQMKIRNSKLSIDTGKVVIHTGKIVLGSPMENQSQSTIKSETKIRKINNVVNTANSIELKTGQKMSINQNIPNISKMMVGLEWDVNHNGNHPFELDTSIFMVDANNKTAEEDFIFYGNANSRCNGVILKKDHNTKLQEYYDETVQLDLSRIPAHIQKLAFTVTIYEADERTQKFGQVKDAYFKIIDVQTKREILHYRFNERLSVETAIVVVEIYRYKNEWKINAIGSGFRGGLEALCDNYGVETE